MKLVGLIRCRDAAHWLFRLGVAVSIVGASLLAPQHLAWGSPATRMTKALDAGPGKTVNLPWQATHGVVQWDGDSTATVQLRTANSQGVWTPWQTAGVDEDGGATQESGMLLMQDGVKVQTQVVGGRADNVRVTAIDTEHGQRQLELQSTVPPKAEAADGQTPEPDIITRAQWGADESIRKGTPDFAPIERMDVHHTVTANNDPNPAATVRAIYQFHVQGNGWNDIGYNFLIDQSGNVYEGRHARDYAAGEKPTGEDTSANGVIGAHTLNHNVGTVGIALLGTFNSAAPAMAQQNALVRMLAWESDRHNIDPLANGSILGHRDLYQTECPGDVAYALLPQWRQHAADIKNLPSYPPGNTPGYWVAGVDGAVKTFGAAANYGSMAGHGLNAPVTSMSRTKDGKGYWLMGADGGIFSFGDAKFFGSMGGRALNAPVVGLAPTPTGNGYWLIASDGGIFAFGDARFLGSMGGKHLNKPVVAAASTPSGNGYWLVAADGGVFAYGDAQFYGSAGSIHLNQPVVTMASAPDGHGYWMFAADGGVFAYNTQFLGSIPMVHPASFAGAVEAAATATGHGYYLLSANGGVYTFGDARFFGADSGTRAAAMALVPEH